MAGQTCTVLKGDDNEQYSITCWDGTEGDLFEYGDLATVVCEKTGDIYYCMRADSSDTSPVFKVVSAEAVETEDEEIEITEDEEDGATVEDGE